VEAVRATRARAARLLAELERGGLAQRCPARRDATDGYVLTAWGERASESPARPDRLV